MSNPLDDLIVCMPFAELGYSKYWQMLTTIPDFGYLAQQGRILSQAGGYIHTTPTVLLKEAMENENVPPWKRLLWLEHDHIFPADVFQKHATYTQPIVGGLYVLRDPANPLPVIYKWDESRHNAIYYNGVELNEMGIGADDKRGLHKVDVVPMGCTSVRRDVFETWPKDIPYYSSYTSPGGTTVGHDVFFCRVAQDNGWPIYVDTSLRVKHLALMEMDDSYFIRWWNVVWVPQEKARLEAEAKPKLEVVRR